MRPAPVSLASEADAFVIAKIRQLLSLELRSATGSTDLRNRLSNLGYDVQSGYLVTAPQGKKVCPMSVL
ncbi:MAG: hypothetical protein AAF701_07240 [Pseudomonadota bacterium]